MEELTIHLTAEEQHALSLRAKEIGLSPEELLRRGLQRVLAPEKLTFKQALEHTLRKNEELYRRLS